MKKLSLVLLLILPFLLSGQDYKLITATSKKLFTTLPDAQNAYSLAIESANANGADSVYFNFFGLNNGEIESDTCWFWTGNICTQQNYPVWAGPKIEYDNDSHYRFYNLNNDSLFFNFNTDINGPVPFYEDSVQVFSITYEKSDTLTVLGNPDSARFFNIIHTDLEGNIINSPLNGQNIIIAKNFGLVRFFVIDSFPAVLKPLGLIGNVSPNAGFYKLTNEMVYDYQPGDEVQYYENVYYEPGTNPPWYNYTRYRKLTFLSRVDSEDSIKYTVRQNIFYVDSTIVETDTITFSYLASGIIAQIPFEKYYWATRKLFLEDYCDTEHWTYTTSSVNDVDYCEADTCWGTGDSGGPPEHEFIKYVEGVGMYKKQNYVVGPDGYSKTTRIVYYNIGGEVCGDEITGVDQTIASATQIVLQPNPASKTVNVLSPVPISQLEMFDATGKRVFHGYPIGKEIVIDLNHLTGGVYFVRVLLENNGIVTKKLIVR